MQKTRHKSDHPGLRKRSKTIKNWVKSNFVLLQQFLDVFSSHDNRINFSSFALCQASQDTSLEYPQRVLWRNFFLLIKGSGQTLWDTLLSIALLWSSVQKIQIKKRELSCEISWETFQLRWVYLTSDWLLQVMHVRGHLGSDKSETRIP